MGYIFRKYNLLIVSELQIKVAYTFPNPYFWLQNRNPHTKISLETFFQIFPEAGSGMVRRRVNKNMGSVLRQLFQDGSTDFHASSAKTF